ncbi:GNAT family N-acetyltransferase [Gammaproteobacteria bacterium]|nr:GNAT family N-acetyltransferase [Gammaproteobacteria bacterium]
MSDIAPREYEDRDWPEVSRIHDLARPIELEGSSDPRAFVPLADDKNDLQEFLNSRKLVVCYETRIVGFIGIDASTIGWLYVDPKEAGKGIGRRLVREALVRVRQGASVFVLEGNVRAISLYESEFFEVVDRFDSDNNGYPCTVLEMFQPIPPGTLSL